jgi:WD40 repeat protein
MLNDEMIISGGYNDKCIKKWDLSSSVCLLSINSEHNIRCLLKIHNYKNRIISGGQDGYIKIWDLDLTICLYQINNGNYVNILNEVNEGRLLVSGSNNVVKVWNIDNQLCVCELKESTSYIWKIIQLVNKSLVTAGNDGVIRMYKLTEKCACTLIREIKGHTSAIYGLSVMTDEVTIVSCSNDKTIKIWNSDTGDCVTTLTNDSPIYSLCVLNDGVTLATGDTNKQIKLWK